MGKPSGGGDRAGDRHKHKPIAYRPPEAVRDRLLAFAQENDRPVASVVTEALTKFLDSAAPECTHAYPDVRHVAGVRVCRICG